MIRTIAATLAAFALSSFGAFAEDPPKADAPAADKKADKGGKKAHKKGKKAKAKKAADTKPADAPK
jgi:hypothetical protein